MSNVTFTRFILFINIYYYSFVKFYKKLINLATWHDLILFKCVGSLTKL